MLLLPILFVILLLVISAFFSAGELGIMTLSRIRVENAARQGDRIARMQLKLRDRPQRFLSTILVGYNAANITLAVYAEGLGDHYLEQAGWSPVLAKTLSVVAVTAIVVIFAELVPKTYAAIHPERLGRIVTVPLYYMDRLLTPINWLFERIVNPLLYLLTAGRTHIEHAPERAEVLTAVSMALSGGQLHEVDAKVAQEALRFSTIDLRDVMTPRVDVTGIEQQQNLGEALRLMRQTGYSRLPVYRETVDEITGVLLLKDMVNVLAAEADSGEAREWFNEPVVGHIREVAFFPGSKSVVDALAEIRTLRSHLAVVVDEHGGTAGIVTLEDILEELIGDIRDENDPDHSIDIVSSGEGWIIATGRARVDNVAELAQLCVNDEVDATSIGGVLMEKLGRPAVVGDTIEVGGFKVTALKVHRNRIKLVRVDFPPKGEDEPVAAGGFQH